ncbi:hypothetical protein M427DRAFT_55758 [Gonapodya prolifera JEL478]|uniref:Uncharacterized protein n=1 Tax=Gonapodya prolifera (strain JEL478) TaxID=1344416 RepID=A0A139AHQ8_GONPJ|nr:hypothetical protein M427DRAFT_55758 [Gonapodya prolifera JEL478]|eukprot:KXS16337.1 hypothetical protein M427DRAFT_55758 [Gonapodya prolifera JEL478]
MSSESQDRLFGWPFAQLDPVTSDTDLATYLDLLKNWCIIKGVKEFVFGDGIPPHASNVAHKGSPDPDPTPPEVGDRRPQRSRALQSHHRQLPVEGSGLDLSAEAPLRRSSPGSPPVFNPSTALSSAS